MEHVNHPQHYNSHPNRIECIVVIRNYVCDIANAIKYLWRAGLKPEMGLEDAEKETEDLRKALWYIDDYLKQPSGSHVAEARQELMGKFVKDVTGYSVSEITTGYSNDISSAISILLQVGLVVNGMAYNVYGWPKMLDDCKMYIHVRILKVERHLLVKEFDSTKKTMNGLLVDGEDYVSKPGCVRETEPEHYDPLNMIVAWGRAYSLTDEVRKKPNGALYSPCENCDLSEYCISQDGTEPLKSICHLHSANSQQYYRDVGSVRYSPRFGNIEVIDEEKEMEQEVKRMEEED